MLGIITLFGGGTVYFSKLYITHFLFVFYKIFIRIAFLNEVLFIVFFKSLVVYKY